MDGLMTKTVPQQPTDEMIERGMEKSVLGRPSVDDGSYVTGIYQAMISAAALPELQALPTSIAPYFVQTGYTHVICRCDRCKAEGPAPATEAPVSATTPLGTDVERRNVAQSLADMVTYGGNCDHADRKNLLRKAIALILAPLSTRPERAYDVVADAVQEVADAAAEAFRKVGIEPNEWDGDDIVGDVKRGIADDIERLARLRDASLYEIQHVAWHFLESGEERVSDSEVAFDLPNADYDKLCELVGEGHPDAAVQSAIGRREG